VSTNRKDASQSTLDVQELFRTAHEEGDLSGAALDALTIDADIGAQIQAGLGLTPDDVPSSEVVLVTLMPDDSGSIRFGGNADAVRDGHNLVLDALLQSKQKDEVLIHTRYLNGHVLFPYRHVRDAERLTSQNYDPNLGTPLYDQTAVLLGTVLAKAREFEGAGVPVRTVTLLITDGADAGSTRQTPQTLRPIVEDLLRLERHIVAAMGIDDGTTDFRRVFREMGIPDQWILVPGNSRTEIRKAFQAFSQSAVKASAGAMAFGQASVGGFAN
jgi:hypothetical protein